MTPETPWGPISPSITFDIKRLALKDSKLIRSYRSRNAERLYRRQTVRRFGAIERVARRKLRELNAATSLQDLAITPGNRLEALRGDRKGQYSIRINNQWRICFVWRDDDAYEVEIVDYH